MTALYRACRKFILQKAGLSLQELAKAQLLQIKLWPRFSSTGIHAADAIHDGLRMIQQDDIVSCLSKSGNTPEIKVLVPLLNGEGRNLLRL